MVKRDHSMLTFESAAVRGVSTIIDKLMVRNLRSTTPKKKIAKLTSRLRLEPSLPESRASSRHHRCATVKYPRRDFGHGYRGIDGICKNHELWMWGERQLLTLWDMKVDNEPKPMNFTQTFQLMQENGHYFVFNDIFKLVYPA